MLTLMRFVYAHKKPRRILHQLDRIGGKITIRTIQADLYRLAAPKDLWITEFILFALMLMGASIGP